MQRLDVHALVAQRAVELIAADLRAAEDDRLRRLLGVQHLDQRGDLVLGGDLQPELLDGVDRQRRGLDLDDHRVIQVLVGQAPDLGRHRRAEQRRLAARRRQRQDLLDVLEEAEVEHLVGLVEHDEAAGVQHQRVTADQVLDASDGADHDVAAGAQLRLLAADRRAAEDGDDVDALARPVGAQRLRDLDAELARRGQHQTLDLVLGRIDVVDQRQAEGGRLAGARLRLADHVESLQQVRDRLLLNRARFLVADVVRAPRGSAPTVRARRKLSLSIHHRRR